MRVSQRDCALPTALDDRPLLMVGIGVLLFSTGPVLVAASSAPGEVLAFWRLWIGAVLLGALTVWRSRGRFARGWARGWGWAAAAGAAFAAHQLFFMTAIKATSVVDVTLILVLQPIVVGVLARLLFGERPGAAFRLWSLVAGAGSTVVVLAGTSGPEGNPLGMLLAVCNVVCFAVYVVWSKQAMRSLAALPFLFGVVVIAGLVVTCFALVVGAPVAAVSRNDLLAAATIAVVPGVLGHFMSTHALKKVPANLPPIMQLATPCLSGALAWLALGQGSSWLHVVGGVVTGVGVVGALRSRGGRRLMAAARSSTRSGSWP